MITKEISGNKFSRLELNYEPRNGFISLNQLDFDESGEVMVENIVAISPVEMGIIRETLKKWGKN